MSDVPVGRARPGPAVDDESALPSDPPLRALRASLAPAGAPIPQALPGRGGPCELHEWAGSGLMALTGWPGLAPLGPPAPVVGRLREVAGMFEALTTSMGRPVTVDVVPTICGRAALLGLHRSGRLSAGGSSRLLRSVDSWIAVNLARPEDGELASLAAALVSRRPAAERPSDHWTDLEMAAATAIAGNVVDQLQLLGVPAAVLAPPVPRGGTGPRPEDAVVVHRRRPPAAPATLAGSVVLDLSAMWAGPLCAHLLGRGGARVVKLESTGRPDGARGGNAAFYDGLHAGHESVAADLRSPEGLGLLRRLVDVASVVIESSRPRALAHMGVDADAWVAARPGRTWVSITGYGRSGPKGNWVGFGDDTAVAGGLVALDHRREPVFCGDALSDPVTGMVAALGAAASVAAGGGHLVEVSMQGAASLLAAPGPVEASLPRRVRGADAWVVCCEHGAAAVVPPTPPPVAVPARAMGADTSAVTAWLDRDAPPVSAG